MNILAKLSIFSVGITISLALICACLDRYILQITARKGNFSSELHELGYIGFLKIFTLAFFVALAVLPIWAVSLAVSSFWPIMAIGDELALLTFGLASYFALTGVATFVIALRRPDDSHVNHLLATFETEPELYKLSEELAAQFRTKPISEIYLNPDSVICIRENIRNLDNIFYGGSRSWQIGFAALQYLSAGDLKVLMAKEYASHTLSRSHSGLFAARLNRRLQAMSRNVSNAGLFIIINPIAWLVMIGATATRLMTREAISTAEMQAQRLVANLYGEARLYRAITRQAVESEIYKDLIPKSDMRRRPGQPELENIYFYMRLGKGRALAESREIIENLLFNNQSGKNRTGLRLMKSPEPVTFEPIFEQPAAAYLKNSRTTETRIMELVNNI